MVARQAEQPSPYAPVAPCQGRAAAGTLGAGVRGDDPETIARRMRKTASERAEALRMGYEKVVNDDLTRGVEAIESLIAADRERLGR